MQAQRNHILDALVAAMRNGTYERVLEQVLDDANDDRIDMVQAILAHEQRIADIDERIARWESREQNPFLAGAVDDVPMMHADDLKWQTRPRPRMAIRHMVDDILCDRPLGERYSEFFSRMHRHIVIDWPLIDLLWAPSPFVFQPIEDGR